MQPTLHPHPSREGSVTVNIGLIKIGDRQAQDWIFSHLLPRVLAEARQRVGARSTRYFDAEEIAAEVLGALLVGSQQFQHLTNRSDLYRLTSVLLRNKCVDAYRRMLSKRRIEVGESAYAVAKSDQWPTNGFSEFVTAPANTDLLAAELLDAICVSIQALKDDPSDCRLILTKLLEGYTVPEVSQIIGRGERYVRRVLERIRRQFHNSPTNLP
jgi:DNA-directed RNA polymerase specialized sigma24 family protein